MNSKKPKKGQILWVWEYVWNPASQMNHSGLWEDVLKNQAINYKPLLVLREDTYILFL